jgi:DNA-binding Lrp family transcriptional regulator
MNIAIIAAMSTETSMDGHRRAGPPPVGLDRVDRQLLHALQIDARASFRRLASLVGVSEQTVARRYRRLHDAGVARVLALPDPEREGQSWLLRIQVQPAAARPLAAALAKRSDVSWIGLMAGGTEIACAVRARSRDQRDALLLHQLPHTGKVLGVTAHALLHRFQARSGADWDGFEDPLSGEQRARLIQARPDREHPTGATLTEQDEPLLALLAQDGRISYAELAARTARPEAQVARRVDALLSSGAIYLDMDIAVELLGFTTSALLYLTVAPAALSAVGEELANHPEAAFVAAVTGPANLTASVLCTSPQQLYRYLTTSIAAMPAIHAVETSPVLHRVKQAGSLMRGPLVVPPRQ